MIKKPCFIDGITECEETSGATCRCRRLANGGSWAECLYGEGSHLYCKWLSDQKAQTPAAGPWNYDLNAAPVGIWLLGKRNGAVIKCLIMKDKNGEWSDSEHRLYLSIDAFAEINTEVPK